jgi:spermidine synthase
MALLWSTKKGNTQYEVRTAGSSLRLYTNHAFHSQYNPKHVFTGAMWDLLSIPALFYATNLQRNPNSVLMLGVGGGTAIHQLQKLTRPKAMIGVEYDPMHIKVAKRFFKLNYPNLELIEADAFDWIKHSKKQFDIVVDDLFVDAPNDPERPFAVNKIWMDRLHSRLSRRGLIVQNHLSTKAAMLVAKQHQTDYATGLLFRTPQFANAILVLSKLKIDAKKLRPDVAKLIDGFQSNRSPKPNFSVKQLF